MVTTSVFDQSQVNCFYQIDSKASLEIGRFWNEMISVKIKESADSKYRANILYQVTVLVLSPKPLIAKS